MNGPDMQCLRLRGRECNLEDVEAGVLITHPNRNTPATNSARATVIALFAASILLMLLILAFGWSVLEGMLLVSFGYIAVYGIIIWRVSQWARGPLALGAALAILLAIFSAIAFPTWSDRGSSGYASPEAIWGSGGFSAGVLGVLTLVLALLQIATIIACVRGFRQEWQVEVETAVGADSGSGGGPATNGLPADPFEDDRGFSEDPEDRPPTRGVW